MTLDNYKKQLDEQSRELALPEPSEQELRQSYESYLTISTDIQKSKSKSISLTDFIQSALYGPGVGYYTGQKVPFGESGDFTTAPEINAGLGRAIANAIEPCLDECEGHILECGAGTGELAVQIINTLNRQNIHWESYQFLDVSASLKQIQLETLRQNNLFDETKIQWIEQLPKQLTSVIIGNEILDAIPAHFLQLMDGRWGECRVALEQDTIKLKWLPLESEELSDWLKEHGEKVAWQENTIYEVSPWRSGWISTLANQLSRGAILLIDYGYSAEEFFHPQRRKGTAKAFFHHRSHEQLEFFPGIQDITSHVNFSELCLAAESNGLNLSGYSTQADFLVLNHALNLNQVDSDMERIAQSRRLQKLLLPGEMGEVFKVIAFTKNISENAFPRVSTQLVSRL